MLKYWGFSWCASRGCVFVMQYGVWSSAVPYCVCQARFCHSVLLIWVLFVGWEGFSGFIVGCLVCSIVFIVFPVGMGCWVAGCNSVASVFMLLMFFASLVMLSLLSGLCSVCFIMCAFCGLHEGHFYMRTAPLLAPVSTVGKSRLVVVAVQGAPDPLSLHDAPTHPPWLDAPLSCSFFHFSKFNA